MAALRAQDAASLYKQGQNAMNSEDYASAAKIFDQILTQYPNTPTIDNIRLMTGYAFYASGDYADAISRLVPEIAKDAHPEIRPSALLFTGLAQLAQAQKLPDKTAGDVEFKQAADTFTTLLGVIDANPTADNKAMRENTLYYRVLAEYQRLDYDNAIADCLTLLQQYPNSRNKPDYNLFLGSFYAAQASDALNAKKPNADVEALAQKSLDAFSQVSSDPNALVQANDANFRTAEVLFMIAPFTEGDAGYEKALEAYRLVRRKADMIPIQQARLDAMKQQAQAAIAASGANIQVINNFGLLIDREEGHLKQLQDGPDPIIQALIRIAECYTSMKMGDEARTVLHRLDAIRSTLTPDQQQDVDFQTLYSYVLSQQADKADAALTDYLTKHPGDPQANGISYQLAGQLAKAKNYDAALIQAQRSYKDFPDGPYAAADIALEADILNDLHRPQDSQKLLDDYAKSNANNPVANQMLLAKAKSESEQGDLDSALADFGKVKDNASASEDLRVIAAASYIQTLQSLKRYDDVIAAAQDFKTKYPNDKNLASVLVLGAIAQDMKHDPGAAAALQAIAKQYPDSDASPFALYYVVNIYQRAGPQDVPQMIQAADALRTAYPAAWPLLSQAADAVGTALVKEKKFPEALAQYQPLVAAPDANIASLAQNKIGDVWLACAKAMGYYQSLQQQAARDEAMKRLTSAEAAYVATLKNFPTVLPSVGDAFDGLVKCLQLMRTWGLVKDDGLEAALDKATADLTSPDMKARVEMAKAGLAFVRKDGASLYAASLDRFTKAADANPTLARPRQEASQAGQLLTAAQQYPKAIDVFNALLSHAAANDQPAQGDAYYGLGAAYLAQGDLANAKKYFTMLTGLKDGGRWHPHILDAQYGLALADESSTDPNDLATAKAIYVTLMNSPAGGVVLQAKAMIGYGRVLEKMGYGLKPTSPDKPNDSAVHYYEQVDVLFGPAVPEQSAEGLYRAAELYKSAGDTANAQKDFTTLKNNYGTTAPDWASKAQ